MEKRRRLLPAVIHPEMTARDVRVYVYRVLFRGVPDERNG
jgi:hypothetical protein